LTPKPISATPVVPSTARCAERHSNQERIDAAPKTAVNQSMPSTSWTSASSTPTASASARPD